MLITVNHVWGFPSDIQIRITLVHSKHISGEDRKIETSGLYPENLSNWTDRDTAGLLETAAAEVRTHL